MAKFSIKIGFSVCADKGDGIWEESVVEHKYYGELLKPTTRTISAGVGINDNVIVSNEISVLSDDFARHNFSSIQYVEFEGAKWKVSSIQIAYPRLIMTTGGVYNG